MSEELGPDQLLALRLQAESRGGLLPLLAEAAGAVIAGRFRVGRLLAAGGQAFVFAAVDQEDGREVVIKQAAFDYRKPIRYDARVAGELRQALAREYDVLCSCPSSLLPAAVALVTGPAVVPAAERNLALAQDELFLVEEKLDGQTLRELAFRGWRHLDPPRREAVARKLAADVRQFWAALAARGWFDSDLSPTNLLIERGPPRLRVLDAGSVVPLRERVVVSGYCPAFTTPRLLKQFTAATPLAATAAVLLPMLAKLLHFLLTLDEPLNGLLPDLEAASLQRCSPSCRAVLAGLLHLDAHPEGLGRAEELLARWTAGAETLAYPAF